MTTGTKSEPPAAEWSGELETRTGFRFLVRPARPDDEAALAEFFANVTPEDRRFRFLTAVRDVGHSFLQRMTEVDHERTEDFLAFAEDGRTILASAMIAADERLERAEVAMAIRSDHKRRGISWSLLEHVARYATARGIRTLESIEARDHHEAIALEREMGFEATEFPGDPSLVLLQKRLEG